AHANLRDSRGPRVVAADVLLEGPKRIVVVGVEHGRAIIAPTIRATCEALILSEAGEGLRHGSKESGASTRRSGHEIRTNRRAIAGTAEPNHDLIGAIDRNRGKKE